MSNTLAINGKRDSEWENKKNRICNIKWFSRFLYEKNYHFSTNKKNLLFVIDRKSVLIDFCFHAFVSEVFLPVCACVCASVQVCGFECLCTRNL